MHTLPKLNYSYDALEPFIDAQTVELHYSKHHATYVEKLNSALEKYSELQTKTVEELLKDLTNLPLDVRTAVQNHGGGHANHSFFWALMSPTPTHEPQGELKTKLDTTYGSIETFIEQFSSAALNRFGSGWAWLVKSTDGSIKTYSTANQDSPLTLGDTPLLGLDVWEHAYYLKYQNRRAEYIKNWWNVVDWKTVEANFAD